MAIVQSLVQYFKQFFCFYICTCSRQMFLGTCKIGIESAGEALQETGILQFLNLDIRLVMNGNKLLFPYFYNLKGLNI